MTCGVFSRRTVRQNSRRGWDAPLTGVVVADGQHVLSSAEDAGTFLGGRPQLFDGIRPVAKIPFVAMRIMLPESPP